MGVGSEEEFLCRAAQVLGKTREEITRDTPVPPDKFEDVLQVVVFDGCSIFRDHLPQERPPTLLEVAQCVRYYGGD